ncbi:hypothetical protein [Rhodoferax antarcticus]|uniref:hypothetical protein n=1 Tax=Rhodoferax antarcticus TaxID=81479 RepID=UPI0011150AAF|nr:hypothetical protein [Rhodoferax antarcticus]
MNMQRNPITLNRPAMVCDAFLRATHLDWQLGDSCTVGYAASISLQQSEISKETGLPVFSENSFSPGGVGKHLSPRFTQTSNPDSLHKGLRVFCCLHRQAACSEKGCSLIICCHVKESRRCAYAFFGLRFFPK